MAVAGKPIVLVGGRIAQRPFNGGGPWVRLGWVLGLRRLGLQAYLVDHLESWRCVDEAGEAASLEESVNLAYFERVVESFGLTATSALVCDDGAPIFGMSRQDLLELAESADLLINIAGAVRWPELLRRVRRKAYIDLDPGFTQLAHAQGKLSLDDHDFLFTHGGNVGAAGCRIPTAGLSWLPVSHPVVLSEWPISPGDDPTRFTTVAALFASARGWPSDGRLGSASKAAELAKIAELPLQLPYTFEIALRTRDSRVSLGVRGGADVEEERLHLDRLEQCRWRIVDPYDVAADPHAYRSYIRASGAELSVAKGIFVETGSGWFSDRTAYYLASGKPALVQDTGFGGSIPVGSGLLAFRTLDDAIAGAEAIASDYESHCRAARSLAEQHFNSDKVISQFLDEVGVA